MSWFAIGDPAVDARRLAAEIEAEIQRLKSEGKLPQADPGLEKSLAAFGPETKNAGLLAMAENFASGFDEAGLLRRRPLPAPILKFAVRILKGILKHQGVFNALTVEVLREQEERLRALERRLSENK